MGQLERYGLYVLCLVIFLILGVAIWGEDPASAGPRSPLAIERGASKDEPSSRLGSNPGPVSDAVPPRREVSPDELDFGKPELPDPVTEPPVVQRPEPTPPARPRTHTIVKNDTLEAIAKRYYGNDATAVDHLKKANPRVREQALKIGSELVLPDRLDRLERAPVATAPAATKAFPPTETSEGLHIVKPNEILGSISTTYYGTASFAHAIQKLNGIKDPRSLMIKQELRLPKKPAKQPATVND